MNNIKQQFSPLTQEYLDKLGGWYVYALVNPIDNLIFYVGKGCGNRVFAHANAALSADEETGSDKLKTIRAIKAKGLEVHPLILRHGLKEKEAFIVESVLIDLFTNPITKKLHIKANMTTLQAGHDMRELGIRSTEDLEAQYGSEPLGDTNDRLVIVNINSTYNKADIYTATRGTWRLNKSRADNADYILSEYRGVVRAVFQMDKKKWQPVPDTNGKSRRYFFTGIEVTDPIVMSKYINKRIVKMHGDSYPIHYINL